MPKTELIPCDPVWQYVLVMNKDIRAALDALDEIGWYHQKDKAKMEEMAQYTEGVAKTLRQKVEALTGWEG